jgi:hypothetical protein
LAAAHRAALAVALTGAAGCGLDLSGERLVVGQVPSGPDAATSASGVGYAPDDGGALDLILPDGGSTSSYDGSFADQRPAFADDHDASLPPGTSGDAAAEAMAVGDGAQSPCARLVTCCQSLIVAPPLALACYAGAQQADGGDAGTCEITLASLGDAGLCP